MVGRKSRRAERTFLLTANRAGFEPCVRVASPGLFRSRSGQGPARWHAHGAAQIQRVELKEENYARRAEIFALPTVAGV